MKNILLVMAIISLFLAPALMAQGKTDPHIYAVTEKIEVLGAFNSIRAIDPKNHSLHLAGGISLYYKGHLILPAHGEEPPVVTVPPIVRMNDKILRMNSDGSYHGSLIVRDFRLGYMINLSIDFHSPLDTPPYKGLIKLASCRIENTIELLFPVEGQVIDLALFPGGVPMRWNFTGTPAITWMRISDSASGIEIFSRDGVGRAITVPVGVLQPGKQYKFYVGESRFFSISSLFSPSSSIELSIYECCSFTTKVPR